MLPEIEFERRHGQRILMTWTWFWNWNQWLMTGVQTNAYTQTVF